MADAHKEIKREPVTIYKETTVIHLELTEVEARVLLSICWRVGGPPESFRGAVDQISRALDKVGVQLDDSIHDGHASRMKLR